VDQVEMFACQAGAEEQEKQHAVVASPEGIALAEFFFKDGQHLIIRTGKEAERVSEAEKCLQRVTQSVPLSKGGRAALISAQHPILKPLYAG
jgi:hypothetical protein